MQVIFSVSTGIKGSIHTADCYDIYDTKCI